MAKSSRKALFINVPDGIRDRLRATNGLDEQDMLLMTESEFLADDNTLAQYQPPFTPDELTNPELGTERHYARLQQHYYRMREVGTVYVDKGTYEQDPSLPEHLYALGYMRASLPKLDKIYAVDEDDQGDITFEDVRDRPY